MNTFLNIHQEFSLSLCFSRRSMGLGMESFESRSKNIVKTQRAPLNRRINDRGKLEQYLSKYASDYYGSKRLHRENKGFNVNPSNFTY